MTHDASTGRRSHHRHAPAAGRACKISTGLALPCGVFPGIIRSLLLGFPTRNPLHECAMVACAVVPLSSVTSSRILYSPLLLHTKPRLFKILADASVARPCGRRAPHPWDSRTCAENHGYSESSPCDRIRYPTFPELADTAQLPAQAIKRPHHGRPSVGCCPLPQASTGPRRYPDRPESHGAASGRHESPVARHANSDARSQSSENVHPAEQPRTKRSFHAGCASPPTAICHR